MQQRFPVSRVVFDLDGTLVDSAPDLAAAMNHVLASLGRPAVALECVRHMVGRGARALIERGIEETGGGGVDIDTEALLARVLDHYGRNIAASTRPYPGVARLLERLAGSGVALGLCTNKPQALTESLLDALGLARHFHSVVGADAVPARKPDPAHLGRVLAETGDGPAVMVGDSEIDVAAARALGLPVILVDFGYSTIPAANLGGDAVVSDFTQLGELLQPL